MRIPSSLRAGVELCGTSVEISPEVALHGVENNTTQGQTTVTGQPLVFIKSRFMAQLTKPSNKEINTEHSVSCPHPEYLPYFSPLPFFVFLLGYMNMESPVDQWVKAQADRGSVKLKTQSWFESLKLGS